MYINTLLKQNNMSKYMLAKKSGIPHTTVLDICNGKTKMTKCNAETLYKIAKALDVTMESLIINSVERRPGFENFKSAICHKVKRLGDLGFIEETLLSDDIRKFYEREWLPESLYLLAMVDYLCRENNLPVANEYNDLRNARFQKPIYPTGVHVLCNFSGSDYYKQMSVNESIPEFIRHNIVESEIRNVV